MMTLSIADDDVFAKNVTYFLACQLLHVFGSIQNKIRRWNSYTKYRQNTYWIICQCMPLLFSIYLAVIMATNTFLAIYFHLK